ncbi:MAG: YbjN domain-containing protein [Bacteroidales bacterium]|nr:YbjN domain-containing protein [Bacteroidales bacterium]
MSNYFSKIKEYLNELSYSIINESEGEGFFVIDKEDEGIKNMVIVVDDPILIMEQLLFKVKNDDIEMYKALLKKNHDILHGAFVLSDDGKNVLFRDKMQVENLDLNELAGSLNSLSLLLGEYSKEIIKFSA